MRTCATVRETRLALAGAPRPVGFVPTLGALHEGHAELFRRCRDECASVVASIFVNPLQFDDPADLERYPRDLQADAQQLERLGVDLLLAPAPEEVYRPGHVVRVHPGPIADLFEGAARPGHFEGVATIVTKLFGMVAPDRAYFGRKDAQQLAVITALVRDLDLALEIRPVETVRDADGLALSSRNARMDAASRKRALGLSRGLFRGREAWLAGERDPERIAGLARDAALEYDYCACVDPVGFDRPREGGPAVLIAAVRLPGVRLIDNVGLPATI